LGVYLEQFVNHLGKLLRLRLAVCEPNKVEPAYTLVLPNHLLHVEFGTREEERYNLEPKFWRQPHLALVPPRGVGRCPKQNVLSARS
jgi:hypothetical protein